MKTNYGIALAILTVIMMILFIDAFGLWTIIF